MPREIPPPCGAMWPLVMEDDEVEDGDVGLNLLYMFQNLLLLLLLLLFLLLLLSLLWLVLLVLVLLVLLWWLL